VILLLEKDPQNSVTTERAFLRLDFLRLFAVIFFSMAARAVFPGVLPTLSAEPAYRLRLYQIHTGERLDIVYRHGDRYDPEALARINRYLRDYRTGDVREYDPRVLDLLHDLAASLRRPNAEIDVVCAYRTPRTNEYLRTHGHGVASHSLHMQAMAIDIRIPGVSTAELRDGALALQRGGVGYYATSSFVHVDVGRVRRW
jgi:uncharacterized protein YcbK (DUF882 family)